MHIHEQLGHGLDQLGGAIQITGDSTTNLKVVHSRFFNDSAPSGSGIANFNAIVTANDNWWGADAFPGSPGTDTVAMEGTSGGSITDSTRLALALSPASSTIATNASTTLTAKIVSTSAPTVAVAGTALEGLDLTFAPGTLGSVNPAVVAIANGMASTTFSSGSSFGTTSPTVTLDNGTKSTTITIVGAPTANPHSVTVELDTPKAIALTGSDPNTPARALTYAIATNPSHGTLSGFNAATGAVTYTPAAGYHGADSFTFTVYNGTNTSPAATVALNVLSTLVVTSTVPTTTGFTATFNEPFALAPLNLYDTATAGFGPADVTLVGASTGPVQGSLVVAANDQSFTFVETGGVLPPDTYTVTLRSAANGFTDTSGGPLDGNGDGTPGDNYTTTFTVAPSRARVVALPDFARGPGQAVNVPATGSGLPLTIGDGTGITSISLRITYNTSLLAITGANLGASAPAGSSVTINTSTPGLAILTFTSPTALPAGPDTFATLVASVPNAAPYASKEVLNLGSIVLNGGAILASDDDGVHVVAYLGDTTGNGGYSSFDATLIRQVVANISTGFAAYPLLDPRIVGDIAGFGTLSGIDATYITQYVANLPQPRIPALPGVTITTGGPDPLIWLPQDINATPGSTLSVPVMFRQTNGSAIGLDSANLAIEFDPSLFLVTGVRSGGLTTGFTLTEAYDNATGAIIASERSTSGPIMLAPGTQGTLLWVDLTIRPGAHLGSSRINLLGEGRVGSSVLYTSLNNGNLTLVPAPTDSDLDPTDGVVTITTPTTPRPIPSTPSGNGTGPVAPALVAAGPPAAIDLAIEASHGESSPANGPPALSPTRAIRDPESRPRPSSSPGRPRTPRKSPWRRPTQLRRRPGTAGRPSRGSPRTPQGSGLRPPERARDGRVVRTSPDPPNPSAPPSPGLLGPVEWTFGSWIEV